MAYRDTDLPVYMYSKKVDYSNDINIAVTFRDSRDDTEGEYESSPIEVRAFLDKRDLIYAAKATPDFEPYGNRIDGIYDPALKTAQVFLPDFVWEKAMLMKTKYIKPLMWKHNSQEQIV